MAPDLRSLRQRLVLPISLTLSVIAVGTLGFWLLWRSQGATVLDALFMTIITVTTIGYGEVYKLSEMGRLWAIAVALVGVGSLFYSFGVVMDYLVARRLTDPAGRRKVQNRIDELGSHIIVAGLGRVGRQAALELEQAGKAFVIIDPSEAAEGFAQQHGYLFLKGDASTDETLHKAGIARASGLIVTTSSDANNLYIVLSARVLNPELHIVSRAADESSVSKLIRAGANRAISPYAIGGRRLAHLILSPTVVDFFETMLKLGPQSLNLEEVAIGETSPVAGQTLSQLRIKERCGSSILLVLRGEEAIPNPGENLRIEVGDRMLALGTIEQLDGLERIVAG